MTYPLFSNQYKIVDETFKQLVDRWEKYKYDIDGKTLLNQIRYCLGQQYGELASKWLKTHREEDWWKEDLV